MTAADDVALVLSPAALPLPEGVDAWLTTAGLPREYVDGADEALSLALRARPRLAVLDARGAGRPDALAACRRLKADSFSGVVPVVILADDTAASVLEAFDAGADEVLHAAEPAWAVPARLDGVLRSSDRDVNVHPTTRLPGAYAIEAELTRRIATGEPFAGCYADLDHFKEFNDRYGYNEGDRVIRMVAHILHDAVKGTCGERGFVGHIGGDDFFFVVPLDDAQHVCELVVEVFDALVPFQYSEPDRRAGYYFGKDRRGQLHRVPLMTLSIGVATTERRRFTRAAQVSQLASEMKGFAKTQDGSLFAVDRRQDDLPALPTKSTSARTGANER